MVKGQLPKADGITAGKIERLKTGLNDLLVWVEVELPRGLTPFFGASGCMVGFRVVNGVWSTESMTLSPTLSRLHLVDLLSRSRSLVCPCRVIMGGKGGKRQTLYPPEESCKRFSSDRLRVQD